MKLITATDNEMKAYEYHVREQGRCPFFFCLMKLSAIARLFDASSHVIANFGKRFLAFCTREGSFVAVHAANMTGAMLQPFWCVVCSV